jgi:hypothetical protein
MEIILSFPFLELCQELVAISEKLVTNPHSHVSPHLLSSIHSNLGYTQLTASFCLQMQHAQAIFILPVYFHFSLKLYLQLYIFNIICVMRLHE